MILILRPRKWVVGSLVRLPFLRRSRVSFLLGLVRWLFDVMWLLSRAQDESQLEAKKNVVDRLLSTGGLIRKTIEAVFVVNSGTQIQQGVQRNRVFLMLLVRSIG
jgi:hypothetical protein